MNTFIFWDIKPCSPLKSTDLSEKYIASIFRSLLATYFMLVSCWLSLDLEDEGDLFFRNILHVVLLLSIFFDPEGGGNIFLRKM
jgi:hypothetical protein